MTVKELIKKLQAYPEDRIVCASQPFCGHEDLYEVVDVHNRGTEVGIGLDYYDYSSRSNPDAYDEDGNLKFEALL